MEFRDLVLRRRMVREFKPEPVPRETLLQVLEVARHAPSAGFSQGFDFLVLDTEEAIRRFKRITEHPDFPYERIGGPGSPPCLVLALSNRKAYLDRYSLPDKERFGLQGADAWPVPYWDVDTGMAVMLILLAAAEAGLGAWLFGIAWGEAELLRELHVPEGCRPIGVIGLGLPADGETFDAERFRKRRRPLESMVHFGRWQGAAASPDN